MGSIVYILCLLFHTCTFMSFPFAKNIWKHFICSLMFTFILLQLCPLLLLLDSCNMLYIIDICNIQMYSTIKYHVNKQQIYYIYLFIRVQSRIKSHHYFHRHHHRLTKSWIFIFGINEIRNAVDYQPFSCQI